MKELLHPGTKEFGFFYITQRWIQYKVRSGVEGAGYLPHAKLTAMVVS